MQRLWEKLELPQEERDFAYARTISSSLLARAYSSRLKDLVWLRSSFVNVFRVRQRAIEEIKSVFEAGKGSRRRLFSDLQILHSSTMRLASLTNSARVLCGKPVNLPTLQVSTDPSKNFLIYLLIENVFTRQNLAMAMTALRFDKIASLVECTNRINGFFDNCKRYCVAGDEGASDGGGKEPVAERTSTPGPGEHAPSQAGGDTLDSSPLTDDIISLYFVLGIVVGDEFADHDLPERWVSFLLDGPAGGPSCEEQSPLSPDDVYAMINAEVDLIEDYQQAEKNCKLSSVKMTLVPVSPTEGMLEVYESHGAKSSPRKASGSSPGRTGRGERSAGSLRSPGTAGAYGSRRNTSPRRFRQIKGDAQLEAFGLDVGPRKSPSAEAARRTPGAVDDPEGVAPEQRDWPDSSMQRTAGDLPAGCVEGGDCPGDTITGEALGDEDFDTDSQSPEAETSPKGYRRLPDFDASSPLTGSGHARSGGFDLQGDSGRQNETGKLGAPGGPGTTLEGPHGKADQEFSFQSEGDGLDENNGDMAL